MRVVHYLRYSSKPARNVIKHHVRHLNTRSGGGGKKKVLAGAVGLTVGAVGGGMGLAYYDPAYRRVIEDNVPLSSYVLSPILDGPGTPKEPTAFPSLPTLPKKKVLPAIIEPKPIEPKESQREAIKNVVTELPVEPEIKVDVPPKEARTEDAATGGINQVETEVNEETTNVTSPSTKAVEPVEPAAKVLSGHVDITPTASLEKGCVGVAPVTPEVELPHVEESQTAVKIEEVISEAMSELPIAETVVPEAVPEPEPSELEAQLILDALKSLDYEPVIADSVLEILVGKAANREKATMATISRLENAMAAVVYEVQRALEHHNHISELVSKSKDMAETISQATSVDEAKSTLSLLMESSVGVEEAFQKQANIDSDVRESFIKLSSIIDKAEQFDLQGPAAAARALLSKSKADYLTSCETAQEHQVDHALVSHYRNSVSNRKKVLEQELAVLKEHFPAQHESLNATFDAAARHSAQVEELNTLITYLSTKVTRLEREIQQQQTSELEKMRLVVEAQKSEHARLLEEKLKSQREQLRLEYEKVQQVQLDEAVAKARDECAKQSERQLAMLKEKLDDARDKKLADLNTHWQDEVKLRESMVEAEYQRYLERSNKLVESIGDHISAQNSRYLKSKDHQHLFLLAASLHTELHTGFPQLN